MYTLAQLAGLLHVPTSTLSYHAKKYKEYLPTTKSEGSRWETYEENALAVLRTALALHKKGKKVEQIKEELAKEYSPIYEPQQEEQQKKTLQPINHERTHNVPTATNYQQMETLLKYQERAVQSAISSISYRQQLIDEKEKQIKEMDEFIKQKNTDLLLKQRRIEDLETELSRLRGVSGLIRAVIGKK